MATNVTSAERTNILKLVAGMFNAAPGAAYLEEFSTAFLALNKDYGALAAALADTGAFKALYPSSLTVEETATKFLTTLGLAANSEAQDFVQAKLNAGEGIASVIFQSLLALVESTSTDAEIVAAQALLANKAAVAEYYSVTLGASSDKLATLQGVFDKVTADPASVEAAKAAVAGGNGQTFMLTAGLDNVPGAQSNAGNDIINGRISEFASFDNVAGGAGNDTLVLTGTLPTDVQPQPNALLDAAFQNTTSVEKLILAGGTLAGSANGVLGQFAQAAGLQEVVAGGTGAQAQTFDLQGFNGALTVTGSGNAEAVNVNLAATGAKALNLGAGADVVNVVTAAAPSAGSVQVNFTSGAVGDATDATVTIVSANGNVTVNDEGTTINNFQNGALNPNNATLAGAASAVNVFNVVGLDANGAVDAVNQNRGNFAQVQLGTSAGETLTAATGNGNVYINAGAGNDIINATAGAAGERHFAVGGAGNDTLNVTATNATGTVVAIMGSGDDIVNVGTANVGGADHVGTVNLTLSSGNNFVRFDDGLTVNTTTAANNDVLVGGSDFDTLAATSTQLTGNSAAAPVAANRTVSNFEALQVTDAFTGTLNTANIQMGINQVNLAAGGNGVINFEAGTKLVNVGSGTNAARAEVAGGQLNNQLTVTAAGTATTDALTIANTNTLAANVVNGVDLNAAARNAFNNQAITATGFETLTVNTGAASVAQTINGITITPSGTATATVNFVGANAVNAGAVGARVVDASGLTGTTGLTATTTNTAAPAGSNNTVTGSAGADTITLGTAANNVNLGNGNDTLIITGVNGLAAGTSNLQGGDGTDTIQTTTAIAATLSVANAFNAAKGGFEVLSVNGQLAGAVDTIRVDNLGVNKVISAGTAAGAAGAGSAEAASFTAPALSAGQVLNVTDGATTVTVTAPASGWTAAQTANAVASAFAGTGAAGIVTTYEGAANNDVVTLTAQAVGQQTDLSVNLVNAAAPAAVMINTAQGTNAVAGVAEVALLTLTSVQVANNETVTLTSDGATFTYTNVSGAPVFSNGGQLAAALKAAADADGDFAAAFTTTIEGDNVRFTAKVTGARTDIALTGTGITAADSFTLATTTQGVTTVPGAMEQATVTFKSLAQGQSVELAGRKVTATTGPLTDVQVADAFEAGVNGASTITLANGASITGTLVNWTIAVSGGNNQTVFTSTAAANVTDLVQTGNGQAPLAAIPATTITQGVNAGAVGAPGQIILQNLASNGTLEITGASTGTHEVRITDSGLNTADVLNLELTNSTNNTVNFGTVLVANTERVNILMKDTGTAANTAATVDNVTLTAAQATSIVVTGNNGLGIAGNGALVTNFDASGVVGNGIDDTAANLGVTFGSANGTAGVSVMIKGGAGNDFLASNGANDTFDLTAGGSDTVTFQAVRGTQTANANNAGNNGTDVVLGFTAGAVTATGAADVLNLASNTLVDANGAAAGLIFNATAANTVGDLVLTGNNVNAYLVTNGQATLDAANVKSQITGATAQNGEILVADGASAYVLQASAASSNVFNVYRAFDANNAANVVDAQIELIGTVNLTNTFGDIVAANIA